MREMEEPAFLCQCRLVPESNEGLLEKVTTINVLATTGTMRGLGFISIRKECLLYCFNSSSLDSLKVVSMCLDYGR